MEEMEVTPTSEEEVTIVDLQEAEQPEVVEESTVEPEVEVTPVKEEVKVEPEVKEVHQAKVREVKNDYVSKFEDIASGAKHEETKVVKKRRKKGEDDERRLRASDLKHDKDYEIKPEYTDEELEEIANSQAEEEANSWINDDIDFDEYDDYYDKD